MIDHRIPLRISMLRYDHAAPVTSGEVEIAGTRPAFQHASTPPTADSAFADGVDVTDLSLSEYFMLRGERDDRFVALPVFLSRSFRHRAIAVRPGIGSPEELVGARVAAVDRTTPAVLNAVGLLSDQYGVDPAGLEWLPAADAAELTELLRTGAADAVIDPSAPRLVAGRDVGRLVFDQPFVAESAYYEKTGVLPIERLLVVRTELTREHRWLASNLYRSFEIARRRYFVRLADIRASRAPIPGAPHHYRRLQAVFGADFWPYGLTANTASLEAALRYAGDQGLPMAGTDPSTYFASFEPFVDGI